MAASCSIMHAEGRGERRPRLLLIDDHHELRDVLRTLLELKGYSVRVAEDGQQALRLMQDQGYLPDLVITDLQMPHDGGTMRRKMLEDDVLASVPVIVLSSEPDTGRSLPRVAAFIHKPVELDELLAAIEPHCR